MEMLLSEKNKLMLQFKDYLYWQKYQKGKRTYWHCIFHKFGADGKVESKCPGRASTIEGMVKVTTSHNHYADRIRVELKRMQGAVQKQAKESKEPPRAIIGDSMELVSQHSQPIIRRSLMSRNIRNIRHKANLELPNPQSLKDLKIPEEFTMMGKEVFLKFDGWHKDERIQVYYLYNRAMLGIHGKQQEVGADATFDPTPLLFGQLWIIFVRLGHSYVPMVFVLMTQRKAESYSFVLERLEEMRPNLSPTSIAVDFERAEWIAFESMFPGIELRACCFHFIKSIVRNVCEKGGKILYDGSAEFRREVNCIAALAFVPVMDVEQAFVKLREHIETSENAAQLDIVLDYFEDNYIGRLTGSGKRRKANFPIKKWNLRALVESDEPRTNNGIESFNGQLIRTLAASHPTIWKLIEGLRREFRIAEQRVTAHWAGAKEPRRGQTYVDLDERIKNTVKRYNQMPQVEFLQSMAVNLGRIPVFKAPVVSKREKKADQKKVGKKSKTELNVITLDDTLEPDDEEMLVNKFGIKLSREQLRCLEPTMWLNGETINFYHQLIVQQNKADLNLPKVFSFDSLFYTQLQEKDPSSVLNWVKYVEIFSFELLLIPIYLSGHWSLVVVNNVKERLLYYDSLLEDGTEHINLIKKFLQEYAIENGYEALDPLNWIGFCAKQIPRQTNTFDCGAFVCQYSKCVSRGWPFNFTESQMDGIRKQMMEEILGGTLLQKFSYVNPASSVTLFS